VIHCDLCWNTHNAVRISEQSTDITLSNNDITDNFRYAIYVEDNSAVNIEGNNIYGNTLYGVFCDYRYCNSRNNWWGSRWGPSFTDFGRGDRITGKRTVRFFPWSSKPLENIGSDWNHETTVPEVTVPTERFSPIEIGGLDTDDDGVPDWWEEKHGYDPQRWDDHEALDPDHDGLSNVEECYTDHWGSNPFYKDIFLEFDWMESKTPGASNKPSSALLTEVQTIFKEYDINLHVDTGNLDGGEQIPYATHFSYADLRDLYWDYFLHNDLNNPRKGIFHYSIVCDYGPGPGFAFVGWDHLDSFDISASWLQENQPRYERDRLIIGGSVHELGHTLGLFVDDHGGNDNMGATKLFSVQWWKYRNYKSCMNYLYTYRTLSYSDGSHGRGDFDDWDTLDFLFFKNTHFEWPKL